MEFEPATSVWKSRGKDTVLGTSVAHGRNGSKLVLVTTASEVVEYCSQARQCVNHWTFRAGSTHALRVAAVRHPISQTFFAVRAGKALAAPNKKPKASKKTATTTTATTPADVLVSWKASELDVSKWRTATVSAGSAVHALLVHPQLAQDVLVVYADGSFACVDDALTAGFASSTADSVVGTEDDNDNEEDEVGEDDEDEQDAGREVVWATVAAHHRNPTKGALLLSMLVKRASGRYELLVYRLQLSKTRREAARPLNAATLVTRHVLPRDETSDAAVTSAAFHAETLSFSVLTSTGDWRMLFFRQDPLSPAITFVSSRRITTLPEDPSSPALPLQKKRKLSNAGTSSSSSSSSAATAANGGSAQFVATSVGPFSYLVVASSLAPQTLVGWDSKFGVQVATTTLCMDPEHQQQQQPDQLPRSAANMGVIRSLASSLHGEVVVASYEHAVLLLHVKNKHSTLASVLGVQAPQQLATTMTASTPPQPNMEVNWAQLVAQDISLPQWEAAVCSEDALEQQLLADLMHPPSGLPTAKQFVKKFESALAQLGVCEAKPMSHRFLVGVARYCLESASTLALWAPLHKLLQSKRLSSRALPELLPTLMKYQQFALLELALATLTDIDERSIVRLLRFFIRKNASKALQTFVGKTTTHDGGNKKASAPCERFLVALLALPINSVFLHHAIRELQLREVLYLLAVCQKYVVVQQDEGMEKDGDEAMDGEATLLTARPTVMQCCAWISALVDAHVTQLVLSASKDASVARALTQLEALVARQLADSELYEGVHTVLSNFLTGVKLPQAHGMPEYSIEELVM